MTDETFRANNAPNPREQVADEIYTFLQQQRGRAMLRGFNVGAVDYPDNTQGPGFIEIDFSEPTDFDKDIFTERGFSDEEVSAGFIVIHEKDYPGEPDARYLNVSRLTGKTVAGNENEPFQPANLNARDIDAVRSIAQLSAIPRRIVEVFGSYRAFIKALGDRDMSGISSGYDRIYNDGLTGGLEVFVDALRKKSKGTLHTLDSSRDTLRRSLMKEDHFAWLQKILEEHFGNELQ